MYVYIHLIYIIKKYIMYELYQINTMLFLQWNRQYGGAVSGTPASIAKLPWNRLQILSPIQFGKNILNCKLHFMYSVIYFTYNTNTASCTINLMLTIKVGETTLTVVTWEVWQFTT